MSVLVMNKNPAPVEFGDFKCPPGTLVEMPDDMFAMLMGHPAAKAHLESDMFEVRQPKSEPKTDTKKGK